MCLNKHLSVFLESTHELFVIIRSKKTKELCIPLIELWIKYWDIFDKDGCINVEEIRNEIQITESLNISLKEYMLNCIEFNYERKIQCDNITEIKRYVNVLTTILQETLRLINQNQYKQVYYLMDATHNLPIALLSKRNWNSKEFWKGLQLTYNKNWDELFLAEERKQLSENFWFKFLKFK